MAARGEKRSPTSHRTPTQESKHWQDYGKKHKAANRKRKAARRTLEKSGKVTKGDGKEVDHKDGNPKNNARSNLRVRSAAKNRAHGSPAGGRATRKTVARKARRP